MSNITYTIRNKCCFCEKDVFEVLLQDDHTIPISYTMIDNPSNDYVTIPFNIIKCLNCKTYQTKYLGNLNLVYGRHVNPIGNIHQKMKEEYCNFICYNKNITGFIEIGAGNGDLSDKILNINKLPYYIIDPFYCGNTTNRIIISDFIENSTNLSNFSANTIITSHVFEHLYNPVEFIKIAIYNNIKYIYICIPDFENSIKNESFCNTLNIEHTFYIENKFLEDIFKQYGYTCNKSYEFLNHSIMFEFEYNGNPILLNPINHTSEKEIPVYITTLINRTLNINKIIDDHYGEYKIYLWPSSAHSLYLCYYGLNYSKIDYLLDNSFDKINKYFYGYNIKCIAMKDIIDTTDKSLLILHGGCFNKEIKITNPNIKVISF